MKNSKKKSTRLFAVVLSLAMILCQGVSAFADTKEVPVMATLVASEVPVTPTIDFTISENMKATNSSAAPTTLTIDPLKITNAGDSCIKVSQVEAAADGKFTLANSSDDFDNMEIGENCFSLVLSDGNTEKDLASGAATPATSLEKGEEQSYALSGKISRVAEDTSGQFAHLTVTVESDGQYL